MHASLAGETAFFDKGDLSDVPPGRQMSSPYATLTHGFTAEEQSCLLFFMVIHNLVFPSLQLTRIWCAPFIMQQVSECFHFA